MATSIRTNQSAVSSQNVKAGTAKRASAAATDRVKTTGKKKPTLRPPSSTSTRRGTRVAGR